MEFKVLAFGLFLFLSILNEIKSDCNYQSELKDEQSYYAYNPNHPDEYEDENHCTWLAQSDFTVKINCSIDMPVSDGSCEDELTIKFGSDEPNTYCGRGTIALEGKDLKIKFDSVSYTEGGRFLCEFHNTENCLCGMKKETRIVGGTETDVNEFPMMAGLVDASERTLYCGATIISETCVITAAHCIVNRNINNLGVVVGEHNVTTGEETSATTLYRLKSCKVHPEYDNFKSDIAMCYTNYTIKYSAEVGPVCLPFYHNSDTFDNSSVTLLGWGMLEFGGKKSDTLQKVQVNVVNLDDCKRSYKNITNNNLCTFKEKKDSCQMDSGGPVLWQNPDTKNLILIGIIAAGIGCADNNPAVNTRVGDFIDWIVAETPETNYCKKT